MLSRDSTDCRPWIAVEVSSHHGPSPRVLADGGYAFLTIHSEHTWPILPDHPEVMCDLRRDSSFDSIYDRERPMPEERLVFEWEFATVGRFCNVFTHSDYVRHCWGKWFEIVDIRPQAHHGFQTVVVLRKASLS